MQNASTGDHNLLRFNKETRKKLVEILSLVFLRILVAMTTIKGREGGRLVLASELKTDRYALRDNIFVVHCLRTRVCSKCVDDGTKQNKAIFMYRTVRVHGTQRRELLNHRIRCHCQCQYHCLCLNGIIYGRHKTQYDALCASE